LISEFRGDFERHVARRLAEFPFKFVEIESDEHRQTDIVA
jgi:hypothetical protein